MKTLVIIDMQSCFHAANNIDLQNNIIRRIWWARLKKYPIILVEYKDNTITLPNIRSSVQDYKLHCYITKYRDGGGDLIEYAAQTRNWPTDFLFAGVNGCFCVKDSANAIRHPVRLLKRCIGCYHSSTDCLENYTKKNISWRGKCLKN